MCVFIFSFCEKKKLEDGKKEKVKQNRKREKIFIEMKKFNFMKI